MKRGPSKLLLVLPVLTLGLTGAMSSAHAADAAADWTCANPTSAPEGTWSYGYSTYTSLLYSFVQFDLPGTFGGCNDVPAWRATGLDYWLSVFKNVSNSPACDIPGDTLGLHPGPNGELSVVRFTPKFGGYYDIAAEFSALPFATVSVSVIVTSRDRCSGSKYPSRSVLWNGSINLPGGGPVASVERDKIWVDGSVDFVVGNGGNFYFNDQTGLSATVYPYLGRINPCPDVVSASTSSPGE